MTYLPPVVTAGALFSAAVLSPLLPVTSAYNSARWVLLLAIPVLLIIPLFFNSKQRSLHDIRLQRTVIFLLGAALLASLLSTYAHPLKTGNSSYLFLGWEVLYILAIVGTGNLLGDIYCEMDDLSRLISRICLIALAVMGLYSVTVLMGVSFWYSGMSGQLRDFAPYGFYNIRFWSHCSTWLMPLAVLGACNMRGERKYGVYLAILLVSGLWVMTALMSGARGHLLAVGLGALVLAVGFKRQVSDLVRQGVIVLIVGVILYFVFIVAIPALLGQGGAGKGVLRTGSSGRMMLWVVGLENSLKDFPFGQGALSYSREAAVSPFATPHSVYVRWAAEYGWLALVTFVTAIVFWIHPAWKWLNRFPEKEEVRAPLAVVWSCIAAAIHGLVSGVFTSPHSLLAGMPVLILLVAVVRISSVNALPDKVPPRWKRYLLLPFAALGLVMLNPTYDWYIASVKAAQPYVEDTGVPLGPRFWLHGRYVE